MAGTKEIRLKIKSVQNTRKITKAMEMVAASKMRKAQERRRQFRPYAHKTRKIHAPPPAPAVRRQDPQHRRASGAGQSRIPSDFPAEARNTEGSRDHPGDDRQGAVLRA